MMSTERSTTSTVELLRQGRREEIWQKYCGFLDLSLPEFMEIQERLLLEQIERLKGCELGNQLLRGQSPTSVEEFRRVVPLTKYEAYEPYLSQKREDVLPEKPLSWARTSGRSGEYDMKWVPVSPEFYQQSVQYILTIVILSSSGGRGDFSLEEGDRILYGLAPAPYASGQIPYGLLKEFPFRFLPPVEVAEKMSFQERIEEGFRLALSEGLDFFAGISSVLVAVGERFEGGLEGTKTPGLWRRPAVVGRMVKGLLRSKLERRPMLPTDLWSLKGIATGGMDTDILRGRIKRYWGRYPIEVYAATELGTIATQIWDYQDMTFFPDVSFLELIPEEEHLRSKDEPSYQPSTLLLDEVEAGQKYEIVGTNLKGGIFVRYRVGDMIEITARRNALLGIDLPQMRFYSRCDDVIDIAGFTRLTEKILWKALADSGVPFVDWAASKEVEGERSFLHLYIETGDNMLSHVLVKERLHTTLKLLDSDYRDLEELLALDPLRVTLLSPGTFQRHMRDREAAGTDLAHLKPPHIISSQEVLQRLLKMHSQGSAS
ncbi:MAG: GH3 auxin-responsive promoter family protein [Anaerolineae bacterium]|nr:GH3 auxin-responsive promoter family protein [Anaerolineae bacterium]